MKNTLLLAFLFLFSSCGLFNNIAEDTRVMNKNRDYILINKTPFNNLKVYLSRVNADDCGTFTLLVTLTLNGRYPFHVSPGETVYIRYCTPEDIYCSGCRTRKLIGNSEKEGNDITLTQD